MWLAVEKKTPTQDTAVMSWCSCWIYTLLDHCTLWSTPEWACWPTQSQFKAFPDFMSTAEGWTMHGHVHASTGMKLGSWFGTKPAATKLFHLHFSKQIWTNRGKATVFEKQYWEWRSQIYFLTKPQLVSGLRVPTIFLPAEHEEYP